MSVIACRLMAQDADLSIDGDYRRTYKHKWMVITDNDYDNQVDVELQSLSGTPDPVPDMWTAYDVLGTGTDGTQDPNVYLQNKSIARLSDDESDRRHWTITCTWSPPKPGTNPENPSVSNPLNRPTVYHLEWAPYQTLALVDLSTGLPITNTAGDQFDPPIEIEDSRPVLVAVKNIASLTTIIALSVDYKNAINSDTFYGASPHHAKVESITSGQLQYENGFSFYSTTFRIIFAKEDPGTGENDGWDVRLVNRGSHYLYYPGGTASAERRVPIETELTGTGDPSDEANYTDKSPRQPMDFVALNSDGSRKYPDDAAADFIGPFQIYPEKPFSALGI